MNKMCDSKTGINWTSGVYVITLTCLQCEFVRTKFKHLIDPKSINQNLVLYELFFVNEHIKLDIRQAKNQSEFDLSINFNDLFLVII